MENRRRFIKGVLGISGGLVAFGNLSARNLYQTQKPDIDALSFCCLNCGPQCPVFTATANNDLVEKKKFLDKWTKELGSITVDDVFCYGCKNDGKPYNKKVPQCTVRICVQEKQLKSCALCSDIAQCDKELWKNWPEMRKNVLKIQAELNG